MGEQILTQGNCGGGPVYVYVEDGKIKRIRTFVFGENEDVPTWTIEARGKNFSAPRRSTLAPYHQAERARIYSEERIKYPLKRVDWDPNGKRNPQNRGKSIYERISWDEALDTVANEIKRIQNTYGRAAVSAVQPSHHVYGVLGDCLFGMFPRFFGHLGFTEVFLNANSWEGWQYGATHVFGYYWKIGVPPQYDLLEDALKNTDLVVYWATDPDSTRGNRGGQESAIRRLWLKELGIKQIFIDPFCNYTAATMGDKWIAPRPGTDTAIAMAIAYVWISENTYDKDYIAKRTIGFEDFKSYITGKEDGVPKTPGWAAELSGVPARVITALAREWASKRTMLACYEGSGCGTSACRQAYAHEWARMMVLLQAMQGLGKPGVNIWASSHGAPANYSFSFPGLCDGVMQQVADKPSVNPVTQRLYIMLLPEAVLNPPVSWLGQGMTGEPTEQQFVRYNYPEPGSPEIRMLYRYGSSYIGTLAGGNRWVEMYQSPKIEFVANQSIWWSTETRFADIILPACTNFERNDISECCNSGGMANDNIGGAHHRIVLYQKKCIEPLYESRPDFQIFSDLAERLGFKDDFTEGRTQEEWIKRVYDKTSLHDHVPFEEFKEKGYYLVPFPKDYKSTPSFRWYYEGRQDDTPDRGNPKKGTAKANELATYSGKIEFKAQSLLKFDPNDNERPPVPHYIPSWEGHTSELAKKYPLQLISPHARFSYHSHYDPTTWLNEIPDCRIFKNGYYWRTVRIHPSDAEARGIKDGDIVKMYNDRGAVLGAAFVTERMKPGVIHAYQASGIYDPIEPGKPGSVDRGGCVNLLAPSKMMSKNAHGMAPNSCLIEISKWEV